MSENQRQKQKQDQKQRVPQREDWERYEQEKSQLENSSKPLSPKEYERAIREIARRNGV